MLNLRYRSTPAPLGFWRIAGGVVGCRAGLDQAGVGFTHIPELHGERSRVDAISRK